MLVLTRKISQTIVINNEINITVLGVKGNQVKFGFEAPKNISVHRLEIQELVNKEESELKKITKKPISKIVSHKSFDSDESWAKPSKRNQYYVSNGKVKSMPVGL